MPRESKRITALHHFWRFTSVFDIPIPAPERTLMVMTLAPKNRMRRGRDGYFRDLTKTVNDITAPSASLRTINRLIGAGRVRTVRADQNAVPLEVELVHVPL